MRLSLRTTLLLGVPLAYGGTLWLILLHVAGGGHERGEPPLLLHWLRDGSLALPGVLAAVAAGVALVPWLVDRGGRLPAPWRSALVAAGAAVAGALALAAGSPFHGALFDAQEPHGLAGPLHLGRDALIALGATLPLAALMLALPGRVHPARPRRPVSRPPQRPTTDLGVTRRAFVGYGAASVAAGGLGATALSRSSRPAHAQLLTDRLHLYVNDGHVPMVDGTLVYMRGYGSEPTGDPHPSLTIEPQVFLADGGGPVASRHYPLVEDDRIPEEGSPAAAGIDPSGIGLHTIHRRHWASFFPRRTIVAETGSQIRLRVTHRLAGPHDFTIDGVVSETIAPGATRDIDFPAPGPGTYIYHDATDAPVNRVLGLFGVLVVVPTGNPWSFDGSEAEFERQWVWILHDIDPEWGRRARMGSPIDPQATPPLPRYFTINDRAGVFAVAGSPDEESNRHTLEDTIPSGHARRVDVRGLSNPGSGTGQLIRLVNTGIAAHQPHFHGNHVWTMVIENQVLSRTTPRITEDGHIRLQHWEDVVELDPLQTKAVMLPLKPPPDVVDEVLANQDCDWLFPMHCHAEMSQTAGGGLYPGGQVTDWRLKP